MKAYKVVNNRTLISARYGDVQYKVGEYVDAPEGTRLFVFKDFKSARAFALTYDDIYECEIIGHISFAPCNLCKDIPQYWDLINKKLKAKKKLLVGDFHNKKIHLSTEHMNYTWLVKKVKLLRKV
jgi:hypothetical protein